MFFRQSCIPIFCVFVSIDLTLLYVFVRSRFRCIKGSVLYSFSLIEFIIFFIKLNLLNIGSYKSSVCSIMQPMVCVPNELWYLSNALG